MLFDTGYSLRFHEATKQFPEKLYALVTPIELTEQETLVAQLAQRGIKATDINYVILSHFHADHIGGVRDFPTARYVYMKQAYEALRPLGRLKKVLGYGFLSQLLPDDFLQRSSAVHFTTQNSSSLFYPDFVPCYDLFNDGSILCIDLPGHAPGHMGLIIHAQEGTYCLVGDACWVSDNYLHGTQPHWLVRHLVLHDRNQYQQTILKLRQVHLLHPEIHIVPCHCSKTQDQLRQSTENIDHVSRTKS
jgi:glyoxylase-like metal-dependent hydrolase (beta-lactamase superfamily II)